MKFQQLKNYILILNQKWNLYRKNFSKKLELPKGFNFITNYNINCSNEGVLSSGSMYICDQYNNLYKITISVGVDTINVYYGE